MIAEIGKFLLISGLIYLGITAVSPPTNFPYNFYVTNTLLQTKLYIPPTHANIVASLTNTKLTLSIPTTLPPPSAH